MTAGPVALDAGARRPPRAGACPAAVALVMVLVLGPAAGGAGQARAQAVAGAPAAAAAAIDSTAAVSPAPATPAAPADPALPAAAAADSAGAGAPAPALPPELRKRIKAAAGDEGKVDLWDTGVNATGAVLMTPLFPGWGQLYAGGGWRAALAFGTEMYFWTNLLARDRQERRDRDFADTMAPDATNRAVVEALATEHRAQMQDFVWWSGGALLIIALDAYVGAHLFDFDHDPVPVPDHWQDVFEPGGAEAAALSPSGPEVTVFQWRTGF